MKHLFLSIFAFLFISQLAVSQHHQDVKHIIVKNKNTEQPVSGATITAQDGSFTATTDSGGVVHYSGTENAMLTIYALGYKKLQINSNAIAEVVFITPASVHLEEVVVSGNKTRRTFTPISDLDVHLKPIANSQEILPMVSGLFIGQHAGGGKAEQIFLRGFDIDHGTDISISVDGMPVNMVSHAHGQGYADLHFVIPEMVEKVDFEKGPYFAEKGNFNTAAFVDFKTKDYLDKSFVKFEGGQYTTGRLVSGLNILNPKTDKGQSLVFANELSYSNGYFEHSQEFRRFNGILKYTLPVSESILNFSASGFTSSWLASGQIPVRAVEDGNIGWFGAIDPNEGGNTSRINLNARFTSYLDNGATLKNQLFYSYYDFELYSNFTFFLEDPVNGDEIKQKEHRNILGYNGSYNTDYFIGNMPVTSEFGINFRQDFVNDIELSHTASRELLERMMYGDISETNLGVYAFQDYQVSPKFNITLGLRYDEFFNTYNDFLTSETNSANAGFISPKLNFTYQVNNHLKLYLYNGRGFHSNDTRVVVPQNGKDILPPAYGNDLGMIWKPTKNLMLQTALWHLWMDQEFVYVGDGGVVEPSGKTQRMGIDFSARYEPVENWFVDVDLNLTNPKAVDAPEGENHIPLAPTFTSIGGITYKKNSGFNGNLRYRLMGDRPANEDNSVVAEGYFVTDFTLNYTQPKWEAGISILNLFNTEWKETQFDTESRLFDEAEPTSEIHFTPGTPFFLRANLSLFF